MNQGGIDAIITLFIVMGLGFILKKRKVFTPSSEKFILELLQKLAIPGLMLYNVTTQFSEDFLGSNYPVILASFLSILAAIIIGLVLARIFGIQEKNQGLLTSMFAFSNTVFIGIPVTTGIFGEQGIPFLMLYYLMNTILFWTLGIYLIAGEQGATLFSWQSIKKIFNPAMLAILIGFLLLMNDISLPTPITSSLRYLRDIVTPLSTLYMGALIADLSFKKLPGLKPTLLIILGRFFISPLLTYGILMFFGFSGLMVQVLVITSALPVMMQISVVASYYGKDKQYTAFMTALTTLLAIFILPLYFYFI